MSDIATSSIIKHSIYKLDSIVSWANRRWPRFRARVRSWLDYLAASSGRTPFLEPGAGVPVRSSSKQIIRNDVFRKRCRRLALPLDGSMPEPDRLFGNKANRVVSRSMSRRRHVRPDRWSAQRIAAASSTTQYPSRPYILVIDVLEYIMQPEIDVDRIMTKARRWSPYFGVIQQIMEGFFRWHVIQYMLASS